MRTTIAVVLIVCCAFTVAGCKRFGSASGGREVVCTAARSWVSMRPSLRAHVSDELARAIDTAARAADRDDTATRRVVGAARTLLHGNAREVTAAAARLRKYC